MKIRAYRSKGLKLGKIIFSVKVRLYFPGHWVMNTLVILFRGYGERDKVNCQKAGGPWGRREVEYA